MCSLLFSAIDPYQNTCVPMRHAPSYHETVSHRSSQFSLLKRDREKKRERERSPLRLISVLRVYADDLWSEISKKMPELVTVCGEEFLREGQKPYNELVLDEINWEADFAGAKIGKTNLTFISTARGLSIRLMVWRILCWFYAFFSFDTGVSRDWWISFGW